MSLTIRALFWFLIVSAATSLVFEAWRGRSASQSPSSYGSDDPGDPSPLETYRGSHIGVGYRALDSIRTPWGSDDGPGVSAVILNWSRFQNVVLIVSGFCDPSLQDVITEIVVWNNSPRRISAEVSRGTVNVRASHRFRNILIPTPLFRTNPPWSSGVRRIVPFQAKDHKFPREFVFPSKVHGVLQLEFQILLYSGMSAPFHTFHR